MENKSNEATGMRPDGNRLLNASLVQMDLNKFIVELKRETTWADSDRNSITIFKSYNTTMVLLGLHINAQLKTHTAKGFISIQVLDGEIKFTTEHQEVLLQKSQMICLHENIHHSVLAVKESFFLLTIMINDRQP